MRIVKAIIFAAGIAGSACSPVAKNITPTPGLTGEQARLARVSEVAAKCREHGTTPSMLQCIKENEKPLGINHDQEALRRISGGTSTNTK